MKKSTILALVGLCLLMAVSLMACQTPPNGDADTTATWSCSCGAENTGNFCPECGEARPEPATSEAETGDTDPASDDVTDAPTDAPTDGATEAPTDAATEVPTEEVTHAPRYDYFDADVKADVTIDPSVYTDMKLTLPAELQVTEQDIADYIDYILFQYRAADNGSVQMTDKPMKTGDDAFIYYKGVIDGEEFEGGSNWDATTPHQLGLGSGSFIPGFEEGLVGVIPANATKDNPVEVHVTFPENYTAELAGKDAIFYVAVEYAVQYTVPAYTRDTVENTLKFEGTKDFYASDTAYLSEFEDYVRTYLESGKAEDLEYAKTSAIWEYLTSTATCVNLPQLELDYYYNAYLEEVEYYYEYYSNYGGASFQEQYPTLEDFAKSYVGVEADGDWQAELRALSEDMVKRDMIIHAIAELEGMEVLTDEEYEAEIQYWVDYYQGYMTKEEVLQNFGEVAIREGALSAKMETWLLEHATFTFETESNE